MTMPSTKKSETETLLEQIKNLIVLALTEQGVKGKRIAEVLGVDPAIVSRILSPKKKK
jgi:predicted transcriptional regulator